MKRPQRAADTIAMKRDGRELDASRIHAFITGYVQGDIPDYQAAALCMAIFLNGMTPQETGYLTRAMIDSGEVMDLSSLAGPFVDKHSTGGVGDKISLILAPIAAACGVKIPMISGRGLGHTGGTLDKLDSIPGYTTSLSPMQFLKGVEHIGFAMTGQSEAVVPADRKMYALRDVTATVESIPLITSSILSKKFAEGADTLVMDVKCGRGAFMQTLSHARELAQSLVSTAESLERRVIAVLTDMNEPLGNKVGNFLEVEEAIDCLHNRGPHDVMEITLRLAAWMVVAAGLEKTVSAAEQRCRNSIMDGSAIRKFRENVQFQGGRIEELDAMLHSTRARYSVDITAQTDGYVSEIDAFMVGMAGVDLGVGRDTITDSVEALAGIELLKKTGDTVKKGETLMRLWAENEDRLAAGKIRIEPAFVLANERPSTLKSRIIEEVGGR